MTTGVFLNSLLEIAKSDLAASKLLFGNGFYLQSTFYLQQGVEKVNKAFAVFNEVIRADEIKSLGHDHIELHKRAINSQLDRIKILNNDSIETKEFLETVSSHTNIDHKGYIKSLEDSRNIKNEWRSFNVVEIEAIELAELIDEIDFEIETPAESLENLRDILVLQIKEKFRDFILPLFYQLKERYPQIDIIDIEAFFNDGNNMDEFAHALIDFGEYLRKFIPAFYKIYTLGLVLYPLVSKVRYPDFEDEFDPIKVFTADHPLINQQSRLHKLASSALEALESIMDRSFSKLA